MKRPGPLQALDVVRVDLRQGRELGGAGILAERGPVVLPGQRGGQERGDGGESEDLFNTEWCQARQSERTAVSHGVVSGTES